jgi:hypothetical protein
MLRLLLVHCHRRYLIVVVILFAAVARAVVNSLWLQWLPLLCCHPRHLHVALGLT